MTEKLCPVKHGASGLCKTVIVIHHEKMTKNIMCELNKSVPCITDDTSKALMPHRSRCDHQLKYKQNNTITIPS